MSSDPPRDDGGTGDNGNGNGSGGVDIGINRSGTRIKMKVLNTPDGAKVFQGSYDTLRNEECWFVLASDNETRCLPVFGNVVAYVSSYFADSACTTRVAGAPVCQVPAYVVEMLTNCPIRWAIYERGPEVTTLYTKSGSSCVAATPGEGPLSAGSDGSNRGVTGDPVPGMVAAAAAGY
ncbi:MAG: hypothetical protein IPI49_14705 [Myxococcales bacterium]|nr:hypothetical protein [Myxococcales bacterium]